MSIATSTKARSITTLARQANFGRWRFSTETGNGCYLTRILGGVDQATELRALNTASGFINSLSTSGLEATVVSIRGTSGRRVGYRLKVVDTAAREQAAEEQAEKRQATLDAELATLPAGTYPPFTTEEAREANTAGLHLYAPQGGAYSHEVRRDSHHGRLLGTVRCVTETLGTGTWVRFAAYRPDGSRVGYATGRVAAAELLRTDADARGTALGDALIADAARTAAAVNLVPVNGSSRESAVTRGGAEVGRVVREPSGTWRAIDTDGIYRVIGAAGPRDAATALVDGIDRRAAEAAELDAWAEEESKRWTPDEVLPSGRFGVRIVEVTNDSTVVQVVQLLSSGRWGATPARYTAETITDLADAQGPLAIDYGAGWHLPTEDTQALGRMAGRLAALRAAATSGL